MSLLLVNLIMMTKYCLLAESGTLDPNVVLMPCREDIFEDVQKRPLKIGVIFDDGVVRPYPEV